MKNYFIYCVLTLVIAASGRATNENVFEEFGRELAEKNPNGICKLEIEWPYYVHVQLHMLPSLKNVHHLQLGTFLESIPSDIGELYNLSSLSLSVYSFDAVPDSIQNIPLLRKLSIAHAHGAIPQFIGSMHQLKELSLHCCDCQSLTKKHFAKLSDLKLFTDGEGMTHKDIHEYVESLPDDVPMLLNYKYEKRPLVVGDQNNIFRLKIEHYDLIVPQSLYNFYGIKRLELGTFIGQMPEGIAKLKKLNSLCVSTKNGDNLPPDLHEALSILKISIAHVDCGDVIAHLPLSVLELNLHCSTINENDFAKLPSLAYLKKVENLKNNFGFSLQHKENFKLHKVLQKIKSCYPNQEIVKKCTKSDAAILSALAAARALLAEELGKIDTHNANPILVSVLQQQICGLDNVINLVELSKNSQ